MKLFPLSDNIHMEQIPQVRRPTVMTVINITTQQVPSAIRVTATRREYMSLKKHAWNITEDAKERVT